MVKPSTSTRQGHREPVSRKTPTLGQNPSAPHHPQKRPYILTAVAEGIPEVGPVQKFDIKGVHVQVPMEMISKTSGCCQDCQLQKAHDQKH
jgi:hypothetical protein